MICHIISSRVIVSLRDITSDRNYSSASLCLASMVGDRARYRSLTEVPALRCHVSSHGSFDSGSRESSLGDFC